MTVFRKNRISDGQGGFIEGLDERSSEFGKCRPAAGGERERGAQLQQIVTHVAYLQGNSAVTHGDRLEFGDLILIVQAVRNPANASGHFEVDCKQAG